MKQLELFGEDGQPPIHRFLHVWEEKRPRALLSDAGTRRTWKEKTAGEKAPCQRIAVVEGARK